MVRERGYAVDDMEVMFGVKCVGVALLNHEGEAEGALSISAPSLRMNKENIREICGNSEDQCAKDTKTFVIYMKIAQKIKK